MHVIETELLRESAEWRLLGLLFECPTGGWKDDVTFIAREIGDPELKRAAGFAEKQAGEGLYHSIFGPGGPAPAREVSYRSWVEPGYLLAELSAYYAAFAYAPRIGETPDHIAVESGFISFLKLKEAFARVRGDDESAELTAQAARTFTREHLAKMTEQLARALAGSGIDYLEIASRELLRRVGRDADRKIRQILPVLEDFDDDLLECG